MKTRVIEICKQRGMSLSELSSQIGIKQSNLSQSLKGNPTIGTLEAIAKCLHVKVSDLFEETDNGIKGYLEVGNEIRKINGAKDLLPVVGTFGIPTYLSPKVCKKDLRAYIKKKLSGNNDSFAGILDGIVLFNIFRTKEICEDDIENYIFYLTLHKEGSSPQSLEFDCMEYSNGEGKIDYEYLLSMMWAEIVGYIDPDSDGAEYLV